MGKVTGQLAQSAELFRLLLDARHLAHASSSVETTRCVMDGMAAIISSKSDLWINRAQTGLIA